MMHKSWNCTRVAFYDIVIDKWKNEIDKTITFSDLSGLLGISER